MRPSEATPAPPTADSERSRRKRVLYLAGLGALLAITVGSGIADLVGATSGGSINVGRPVDSSSTSERQARILDPAQPPTTAVVRTDRPVRVHVGKASPAVAGRKAKAASRMSALGSAVSLPAAAIGSPITVRAPAISSDVTALGTIVTEAPAPTTTTTRAKPTGSRPSISTDTTPMSIPSTDPVTIIRP